MQRSPSPPPAGTDTPSPTTDFNAYQDSLFANVLSTVKTAGAIAASDISFQRSSSREFNAGIDEVSARVLALAHSLLKSAAGGSGITPPARLRDVDDVENGWGEVVEIVDYLLEKADTCLDEYTGAIKQKYPTPLPNAQLNTPVRSAPTVQRPNSWQSRNLPKPQLSFVDAPNPHDTSPFKPLLTSKPHAVLPLTSSIFLEPNEEGTPQYVHPYRTEITTMTYPPSMYVTAEPIPYRPFDTTTAAWISTPEALEAMLTHLRTAKEIAVDLEHHDTRSYVGFTCLMQVSTRDEDFIVDTLSLRGELQILNEVFTDPGIVKVLHGAYMDVKWLQRDFGLYLVGLFDTHYASKALGFPGLGLAYLLKRYVGFDADKQYQLADWRIRPLTKEMFDYARSDTHFLLYIFDHLRNELIARSDPSFPEEDRLQRVLQDSKEVALKRYEREPYDAETGRGASGWYNMVLRDNLTPMQLAMFKAVHQWRDNAAKDADESTHYVLSRRQLFGIARNMPTDAERMLKVCVPTSHVVRARVNELVELVKGILANPPVASVTAEAAAQEGTQSPEVVEAPVTAVPLVNTDIFSVTPAAASIKADKSAFWGPLANVSSHWETGIPTANISLAVELPPLTAAVWATPGDKAAAPRKAVDPGSRAEHQYVKGAAAAAQKKGEADVIVVKSLGGARKRKTPDGEAIEETTTSEPKGSSGEHEDAAEGEGQGDSEDVISLESARKKAKKERKGRWRDKKRLAAAADQDAGDASSEQKPKEIQAFDYSKAPAVFNGHKDKDNKGKGKERKPQQQRFDPYAKSGDAPRGMSRGAGQKERPGKSHTFKQ